MTARIGPRRGSNYPFAYYHLAECRRRTGDPTDASEYDLKAASTHFGARWERLARERLTSDTPTQAQPGCEGSSSSAGAAPNFFILPELMLRQGTTVARLRTKLNFGGHDHPSRLPQ